MARVSEPARNLLLNGVMLLLPFAVAVLHAPPLRAQASAAKTNIDDTWQGTLHAGRDLRLVLKIAKAPDGSLKSNFYSIDQGGQPLPVKTSTFEGGELKLGVDAIDGTYVGKMSADGSTITGEWKQGDKPLPLILLRATAETAWVIPEPPPRVPPMAADAKPTFEVATIKPSKPDAQGKAFRVQGRSFSTFNTTLNEMISFAYNVQSKQIVGGPEWMDTDKFDVSAQPDLPGQPNDKQLKNMFQKLLVDRFGLKFHPGKKEMSAYVLTVVKSGPKLEKNTSDATLPGLFFTKLGSLRVTNATMDDFSNLMQSAVFDRPVVNQTALEGRWNFNLKWTPDETQFAGFGIKIPPPSDAADAPPPVFKAIQEQIGLKLEAGKPMVDVMILDHVEKPSDN